MLRVANILVPVNPLAPNPALSQALLWAHCLHATVHAVDVQMAGGDSAPACGVRFSDAVRRVAQAQQERLGLTLNEDLHTVGFDAASLAQGSIQYAAEHNIDLIVASLPLHELTDLTQRISLPVHIVRRDAPVVQPPQRMLVPIDFSRHAQGALAHARLLAASFDASLHVLHVLERPPYVALSSTDMLALSDAKLPERRARRRAETLFDSTTGPPVDVRFHVAHGDPAREIAAFVEAQDIDLLVVSSHGSSGRSQHPLGTVADKLVRRLDTSIFLIQSFGTSLVTPASDSAASNS